MMEAFLDAALTLNNRHLREWKGQGKKIIGYTCSYVPDEIFHSADILPFRLRGTGTGSTTVGDTYFGPFICSFPKCILQLAGEGQYDFLDGVVVTPGCDSMRRLDECWRKAGHDDGHRVPGFFHYFGVPHKRTDYSLNWFVDEMRNLIKEVEDHFRVSVNHEKLHQSIALYNEGRTLLQEMDRLRTGEEGFLSGTDALAVVLAGTAMPKEIHNQRLKDFIKELKQMDPIPGGKKRIMLVGSANDDMAFVKTIESDRAVVVADNLCFGPGRQSDRVEETGDPVEALARRYLYANHCPRMFGDYKQRLRILKDKIERAKIDGVILQNIRFCDLHGSENGLFEKALEAMGVPCLRLEREYGPLVETGRIKMRLDAFIERISRNL